MASRDSRHREVFGYTFEGKRYDAGDKAEHAAGYRRLCAQAQRTWASLRDTEADQAVAAVEIAARHLATVSAER